MILERSHDLQPGRFRFVEKDAADGIASIEKERLQPFEEQPVRIHRENSSVNLLFVLN